MECPMLSIEHPGRCFRLHYKGLSLKPNILSGTCGLSHVWRAAFLGALHFVSSQSTNRSILWEKQRFLQWCDTVFITSLSGPLLHHYCLTSASLFAHVSLTYGKRQIIGTPYIQGLSDANSPQPVTSKAGTRTSLGTRWKTLGKVFNSSMCRSVTEREVDPPTHSAVGRKGMWVEAKDASSSTVRASYHCPSEYCFSQVILPMLGMSESLSSTCWRSVLLSMPSLPKHFFVTFSQNLLTIEPLQT